MGAACQASQSIQIFVKITPTPHLQSRLKTQCIPDRKVRERGRIGRHARLKILESVRLNAYGTRRCDEETVFRPDIGPKLKLKNNARCGRDGMVDIPDLKSVGRMPVWVRLPPPAPNTRLFEISTSAVCALAEMEINVLKTEC